MHSNLCAKMNRVLIIKVHLCCAAQNATQIVPFALANCCHVEIVAKTVHPENTSPGHRML